MSHIIANRAGTQTNALGILFAALLGFGIVFLAGHAQSSALHDAAHDIRHGTGFPCH
jgi:cobalt transporter subunit CbtB